MIILPSMLRKGGGKSNPKETEQKNNEDDYR